MKNLHLIPTDKPSRLYFYKGTNKYPPQYGLRILKSLPFNDSIANQNIYITNSEDIEERDWFLDDNNSIGQSYKLSHVQFANPKKIILATDQDLIKDGVQDIDNEFLEWFVKNPSCEEVKVEGHIYKGQDETEYKIIIPKEELTMVDKLKEYLENTSEEQIQKDWDETCKQTEGIISPTIDEFMKAQQQFNKQETLEEAAKRYVNMYQDVSEELGTYLVKAVFQDGAKWQQQNSYSEEEVENIIAETWIQCVGNDGSNFKKLRDKILKQFKNK